MGSHWVNHLQLFYSNAALFDQQNQVSQEVFAHKSLQLAFLYFFLHEVIEANADACFANFSHPCLDFCLSAFFVLLIFSIVLVREIRQIENHESVSGLEVSCGVRIETCALSLWRFQGVRLEV